MGRSVKNHAKLVVPEVVADFALLHVVHESDNVSKLTRVPKVVVLCRVV